MKKITIYHNPRCSKSRQALQLLLDNQQQPNVIEYLKTPLKESEVTSLLRCLGLPARDVIRKNEQPYKDLALSNATLSEQQLIKAIVDHPILLERPIVVIGNKAIIARPPETVLELL